LSIWVRKKNQKDYFQFLEKNTCAWMTRFKESYLQMQKMINAAKFSSKKVSKIFDNLGSKANEEQRLIMTSIGRKTQKRGFTGGGGKTIVSFQIKSYTVPVIARIERLWCNLKTLRF
jgi:hypothetical protein